jgi:hypothetical protein
MPSTRWIDTARAGSTGTTAFSNPRASFFSARRIFGTREFFIDGKTLNGKTVWIARETSYSGR